MKNSLQTWNNSRVSCYALLPFFVSHLRQLARASCYRSTCILLRFHVYCATEVIVNPSRFNRLGAPPVVTCSSPCRNTPVVGKARLWKTLKTTALPASLAERKKGQHSVMILQQRAGPESLSRTKSRCRAATWHRKFNFGINLRIAHPTNMGHNLNGIKRAYEIIADHNGDRAALRRRVGPWCLRRYGGAFRQAA